MAKPKRKSQLRRQSTVTGSGGDDMLGGADAPGTRIDRLPFVRKGRHRGRDFWCVKPTGDHDADFELGRSYARQALDAAIADKSEFRHVIIGWALNTMARKRGGRAAAGVDMTPLGSIESGFVSGLVDMAIAGHGHRRDQQQAAKRPDVVYEAEGPLTELEGTLAALDIVFDRCFTTPSNPPGKRALLALGELVHTAGDHAQAVRRALWPDEVGEGAKSESWRLVS